MSEFVNSESLGKLRTRIRSSWLDLRTLSASIIATLCLTGTAQAVDYEAVKTGCEGQYGSNFVMVELCVELLKSEAAGTLAGAYDGLPADVAGEIERNCESKWSGNYIMRKVCVEHHTASWHRLNRE